VHSATSNTASPRTSEARPSTATNLISPSFRPCASLATVGDVGASRLLSGLDDVFALVAGRFFQRELRARAEDFLAGTVSDLAGAAAGTGSGVIVAGGAAAIGTGAGRRNVQQVACVVNLGGGLTGVS
jgi:hypothetical protein